MQAEASVLLLLQVELHTILPQNTRTQRLHGQGPELKNVSHIILAQYQHSNLLEAWVEPAANCDNPSTCHLGSIVLPLNGKENRSLLEVGQLRHHMLVQEPSAQPKALQEYTGKPGGHLKHT